MAREFFVNGECLIKVKGNGALALSGEVSQGQVHELGMTADAVHIVIDSRRREVFTDGFGREVAAERLGALGEAEIRMTLIQFDVDVLDACIAESLAGGLDDLGLAGTLTSPGVPFGGWKPLYVSGNHYVGLSVNSPMADWPWHFPAATLVGEPVRWPIGVERSLVELVWRAVPYIAPPAQQFFGSGSSSRDWDATSSGVVLWDGEVD